MGFILFFITWHSLCLMKGGNQKQIRKFETLNNFLKSVAKGMHMKTPLMLSVRFITSAVITISLSFSGLVASQAFAADAEKLQKEITKINKELKTINRNTSVIKKHEKDREDLQKLHKAEKSGLSAIVKAMSPEGGRFEIQADGAIRITPDDKSIVNKLLEKSDSNKKSSQKSAADKKISKQSLEIIERLRKANNQGLSTLLNKLSTGGGRFELIEDGGIRIIPNNTDKVKALAQKTEKARKVAEKRELGRLSHKLQGIHRPIDSWSKVKKTANAWLKKENRDGLVIGKIRLIKWLYIVSIVTDKGKMDTQLVIRASDGKTVAFSPKAFEVFN